MSSNTDNLNGFSPEFLVRCRDVTKRFEDANTWTVESQLLHIFEEVSEVQRAIRKGDLDNLQEELIDVILASITMFHKFGIEDEYIQDYLESKLQKVEVRSKRRRNTLHSKSFGGES